MIGLTWEANGSKLWHCSEKMSSILETISQLLCYCGLKITVSLKNILLSKKQVSKYQPDENQIHFFFSYLVLTEKVAQFLMDSWHLKRKEVKLVKGKQNSCPTIGVSYCQAM